MNKNRIKKELIERTFFGKIWGGVWFERIQNLGHDHRYFVRSVNGPGLAIIKWNNFNPRDFKVVFPVRIRDVGFFGVPNSHSGFLKSGTKTLIVSHFVKEINKAHKKGKIRTKTIPKL